VATALLIRGSEQPRRVLCGREIQRSIRDSVKALLDDCILRLGLGPAGSRFYQSTQSGIFGANGTRFIFTGLRHNVEQIKSIEGITDVWLEEARTLSRDTLDTLEPTIRAPGSRLIYSYNPRSPDDPVDAMFWGPLGRPPRSIRMHLQPEDNPWFPEVLREKMEYDAARDYARFLHIWRGAYWERDDAKVFTDWEVADFDSPQDAVVRFGADWGYSVDPTVLVRCFIGWWDGVTATPDWRGDTLFVDHEAFKVGCAIDDTPALFAGTDDGWVQPRWRNPHEWPGVPGSLKWPITADSARPETIAYMAARGFNMQPALKGTGSVEDGVAFLQSYRIVIHSRCVNTADEVATYSYKVDPLTEQVLPILKDKKNNTIDALRYALEGVRRAGSGNLVIRSASPRLTPLGNKTPHQITAELRNRAETAKRGWGSVPSKREGIT
jgi:phage terminase large subunit